MSTRRPHRAGRRCTALALAPVLAAMGALSACSGGGGKVARPTTTVALPAPTTTSTTAAPTTTTAAPTTTTAPARYVLTGLAVTDAATQNRPALVVKIDNHPEAVPQTGINQADVVVEEIVEGITRLFVVFQSTDSVPVGPIRSARTTDVNLVADLDHPLFAFAGGNPTVLKQVGAADLTDVGVLKASGPGGYHRDNRTGAKGIEHTLYADTPSLYALAPPGQGAPTTPLFPFRADGAAAPAGDPVTGVRLTMSGTPVQYLWDATAKGWVRSEYKKPHADHDDVPVAPANVVIQFISYAPVPGVGQSQQGITVGHGEAWVLTDGKLVKGTWDRPNPKQPAVYADAAGQPIALTPGRTWVELPESGDAAVIPLGADPASVPYVS